MNVGENIKFLQNCGVPLKIMEVCGTHTSAIVKSGISGLLPPNIKLVSGPGCPVCVTEAGFIDGLAEFAQKENSCVLSFGDLYKIRGTSLSFTEAKASGGSFEIVYSPLDALNYARNNPNTKYVLAAVGFETTLPVYALLIETLIKQNIKNVKIAASLKTIIPAMSFICERETVDAFICPGHVSVIIGKNAYLPLLDKYKKPFVITGFEPEDIIAAIREIVLQAQTGEFSVENMYKSVVSDRGNEKALELIDKYFTVCDGFWRGIGKIEKSAFVLKNEFSEFVMENTTITDETIPPGCRCADVLLGRIIPTECGLFGKACRTDSPVGACMTSREGACAVWYKEGG